MASSLLKNQMRNASAAIALAAIAAACTPPDQEEHLAVKAPLHLEDQMQHASYSGPDLPQGLPRPVEWRFAESHSDWTTRRHESDEPLQTELLGDGVRLHLTEADRVQDAFLGLFVVSLPGWNLGDWDRAILQIRTKSRLRYLRLGLNLGEGKTPWGGTPTPYVNVGGGTTLIADGNIQSYSLPLAAGWPGWTDPPWNELVLVLRAEEPADLDLISLTLVPKAAVFGDATAGSRTVSLGGSFRRSLYVHAEGRLRFPVQVPKGARLATALGVPTANSEVDFRISLLDGETTESVLEEGRVAPGEWHQRSVDLSAFAGRKVSLELAADGGAAGDVALWGAPTITTPRHSLAPNIILYVIDGAGADWMSLYGYDRETTPNLEAAASEGVVFERAYSNATWTKLSNPSFLTSLYPTALGYFRSMSDRVPEGVDTLSDHFRRAGYLTSFITSNPVGSVSSNLQEGPDATTTVVPEFECVSSAALQEEFWAWRDAHPDSPYLVHIQTTDVHEPFKSQPPFAGRFLDEAAREEYFRWDIEIEEFGGWSELEAYPKIGTTKERYAAAQQALYDECMVHQDIQITQLIEGLKARGEWQNTLLVVTSDHGYPAGSHRLMDPMELGAPFFHTYATRVPMLVVWSGKIPGGVRLSEPVSLIDLLPTLLELAGLSPATRVQGRSLADALLAGAEPEPRPFFIDMPGTDFDANEMIGTLEIVDGRWGASLVINSRPYGEVPENRAQHGDALESHYARSEPLVVYDLIEDPFCQQPVNGKRPELVDHYRRLLEAQRARNLELRESLGDAGATEFDPDTLERLRALGYLQ
jgi:arylsulfatase A-like enzyme